MVQQSSNKFRAKTTRAWHNEHLTTLTNNQADIIHENSGQGSFAKQQGNAFIINHKNSIAACRHMTYGVVTSCTKSTRLMQIWTNLGLLATGF